VEQALSLLAESAEPRGVLEPVTDDEFSAVLRGAGRNAEDPVVGWIYPRAEALALFAATLGPRVTEEIEDLFAMDDVPLAVSLDAAASRMAENASGALAGAFARRLPSGAGGPDGVHVLAYSPGYCGWHVTGQGALFARLRPERIGITLGESSLMHPLKSVSGVLIAGDAALHTFETGFTYCSACRDRTCAARMRSLQATEERTAQ
jgi:hypothetical protein